MSIRYRLVIFLILISSRVLDAVPAHAWWYNFIANLKHFNNNHADAERWYGKFLTDESNSPVSSYVWHDKFRIRMDIPPYMYKDFLYHLKKNNNTDSIIQLMPLLETPLKHDTEVQLLFAQVLQQAGYQTAADQKFIRLLSQAKDQQEVALHAAQVFLRRKEPENALETIKKYLDHAPGSTSNFVFHFLQAQIYLAMNNNEEALKQLNLSLDLQPTFDKAWLLFALLHEQKGALPNAIKGYTTFLEVSPVPSAQIQEHLLNLVIKQKLLEAKEQKLEIDTTCFDQAVLLFKHNKYQEALKIIDKCLKEPHDTNNKNMLNIMHNAQHTYPNYLHGLSTLHRNINQMPHKQ